MSNKKKQVFEPTNPTNFLPNLAKEVYPHQYYDAVYYNATDMPSYYLGTAAARANDAMVDSGKFYVDTNGTAIDEDAFGAIISLYFDLESEKDGIYIFVKKGIPTEFDK